MNLAVFGIGHVGLVIAACFASLKNKVACYDVDEDKIDLLSRGKSPIYEPGLQELLLKHNSNLEFINIKDKVGNLNQEIIFICVDTPKNSDGSCNLKNVNNVVDYIICKANSKVDLVIKSTVTVGTHKLINDIVKVKLKKYNKKISINIINNPEFLCQGEALKNFMYPDRLVLGCNDIQVVQPLLNLYNKFIPKSKIIIVSNAAAELGKYAANAMLATKISFMNEMANICENLDIDVEDVRQILLKDKRIGEAFTYPGCGYGGSCFPKDLQALINIADFNYCNVNILKSVQKRNVLQHQWLAKSVTNIFGNDLRELKIGLLGLSFKPYTDDIRNSPAISFIDGMQYTHATILAFDPRVKKLPINLTKYCHIAEDLETAIKDIDVLVIATDWPEFTNISLDKLKRLMHDNVIIDGRNIYDPSVISSYGFRYIGVGRKAEQLNLQSAYQLLNKTINSEGIECMI